MKTKRNTEILQAIPTGTTMWKWMLGALVVPYGAVRVCIVGYRWTDVGVMTEHNPPRQQLPTLVTLWHWGLQGKGGGFWASRQIAQQYDHRKKKHLTLKSLHQVYRSSQGWWFWLWTLNGSTKLLHSRHTQSDTHLHLSAYLQRSGIRTHWDGRCTWLHSGRECWRTHQCRFDTWCQ